MITVDLCLPQLDLNWPTDPERQKRFSLWSADFYDEHKRLPNMPEVLEWAYQEGIKDGNANEPDSH